MRRQPVHRWILWFLPLFAVRALIPSGFMVASLDGAVQLVLCSGAGVLTASQLQGVGDHEHHHHLESGHTGHHSGSGSHENTVCPFALAGSAFLANAATAAPYVLDGERSEPSSPDDRPYIARLISTHRIRGPPLSISPFLI